MKKTCLIILISALLVSCSKRECRNCKWLYKDRIGNVEGTIIYDELISPDSYDFTRENVCKDAVVGKTFRYKGDTYSIASKECH